MCVAETQRVLMAVQAEGKRMSMAMIVTGLGYGDESKGATVDKLTRKFPVDTIVRYNGGSQCAHNVVTPEGVHHCFSQFGAGMLANNKVKTHLSRFMLVNPLNMMREAEELGKLTDDVWGRTTVDRKAVIITPYHRLINRRREDARGESRHGSCGAGVGVAREWHLKYGDAVLLAGDCVDYSSTRNKMRFLRDLYCQEVGYYNATEEPSYHVLTEEYRNWPANIVDGLELTECMVFEGAQGVLLDETHGTAPHNTWTDTTFNNANTLLDEIGVTERVRIGCLRTYHTRHGHGPFSAESHSMNLPEPHNGTNEYQGLFRVGHFDFIQAQHAIDIVGGIDYLALSHIDYLERMGLKESFADDIAALLDVPLGMRANGPTAAHREITFDRKKVYA